MTWSTVILPGQLDFPSFLHAETYHQHSLWCYIAVNVRIYQSPNPIHLLSIDVETGGGGGRWLPLIVLHIYSYIINSPPQLLSLLQGGGEGGGGVGGGVFFLGGGGGGNFNNFWV